MCEKLVKLGFKIFLFILSKFHTLIQCILIISIHHQSLPSASWSPPPQLYYPPNFMPRILFLVANNPVNPPRTARICTDVELSTRTWLPAISHIPKGKWLPLLQPPPTTSSSSSSVYAGILIDLSLCRLPRLLWVDVCSIHVLCRACMGSFIRMIPPQLSSAGQSWLHSLLPTSRRSFSGPSLEPQNLWILTQTSKTIWQHGIYYTNSKVPPRACGLPSPGLLTRTTAPGMKSLSCNKSHDQSWFLWLARESILLYSHTFCRDK